MRQSCWGNTAIARVWEKAHTGFHSCYHQASWKEAHGSLRSGRAAAAIEGLATAVVALQEEEPHTAMRLQAMAVGKGAGTAAEDIAVGVVAVQAAAVEVAEVVDAAADIAQARESAWAPAATWRKTCRRILGDRWSSRCCRWTLSARAGRPPPSLAAGIGSRVSQHALRGRPRESCTVRESASWSWMQLVWCSGGRGCDSVGGAMQSVVLLCW